MPDAASSVKRCSKCGEVKPLDTFHRMSKAKDGRQSSCKACQLAADKLRAERNPEGHAAAKRRWYHRHKEQAYAAHVRWREEHPEVKKKQRERCRRIAEDLTDGYVAASLMRLPTSSVPKDMLELKREQVLLKRAARELSREIANQLEKQHGN